MKYLRVAENIYRVTAGIFRSNAYLCADPRGDFVVDPGLDPETIDTAARDLGIRPRYVFCTHGHFDHIGGAVHFERTYGAEVFLHAADLKLMKAGNFMLMAMKIDARFTAPNPTLLSDETAASIVRDLVKYRPLPGHTPGSSLIEYGSHIFSGDSLYAQGVGLSSLPGEDHALLRRNLQVLMGQVSGNILIHPGHGPSAPFGEIIRDNQALAEFLAETIEPSTRPKVSP